MDWVDGTVLYGVLLVSLVVHEAAHAVTALWGGDKTAYLGGQVTLNPVPHMRREPFGTVLLPVGLLIMSGGTMTMGYAHTPIDPLWAHHNPRKAAVMSAAGPISNFLLAFIAAVVLKVLVMQGLVHGVREYGKYTEIFMPTDGSTDGPLYAACMICTVFLLLNILLGVLNLIPFPPLDGAGVVSGLSKPAAKFYDYLRTQPVLMILGIVAIFFGVQRLFLPVFFWAVNLIAY